MGRAPGSKVLVYWLINYIYIVELTLMWLYPNGSVILKIFGDSRSPQTGSSTGPKLCPIVLEELGGSTTL